MMFRDRGKTWQLADGSPLDLPVGVESEAFFARTDVDEEKCTGCGHD